MINMRYEQQSDEELCLLVKSGDLSAEEELVIRYQKLVSRISRNYYLINCEADDKDELIQEGNLGLIKAIRDFDLEKNTKFSTFAETCVRNSMISLIRSYRSRKQEFLNMSLSLDSLYEEDADSESKEISNNPEDIIIQEENIKQTLVMVKKRLSSFEYQVLGYYINGFSYLEISKLTHKTKKSVDGAIQRIRNKVGLLAMDVGR